MIIDRLTNASLYHDVHPRFRQAFDYLKNTDLDNLPNGTYYLDGDNLYAIVREYETLDPANEEMESHRKYIDVQYMICGVEMVGHAVLTNQTISKAYDEQEDYVLYADCPTFFSRLDAGTFMILFPSDLHMPCIREGAGGSVKKIVIKVKLS